MEAQGLEGKLEFQPSAIESFPRDLLRRLRGDDSSGEQREEQGGAPEELELDLNLGLSLSGCFGVDPKGKKLVRSSSIASFSPLQREPEFPVIHRDLVRTSSLPSEADEEKRKRKELQGLKRLEAKRKRLEKRNSIKVGASSSHEVNTDSGKNVPALMTSNGRLDLPIGSKFSGVFSVAVPPKQTFRAAGYKPTAAEGSSAGPQGNDFCGAIELDGRATAQDLMDSSTLHSSSSHKAGTVPLTWEARRPSATVGGEEGPSKKVAVATYDASVERKMMGEMPCVFTKGDGPDAKRIEGFLYKYKKHEEVKIVCVCHGSFLTPAEFVRHAGGGDVDQPLKHIVVCSSPGDDRGFAYVTICRNAAEVMIF